MVKTEMDDWTNTDTPKKELYFEAKVTIKCRIAIAKEIRVRLGQGSARLNTSQPLFFRVGGRELRFGPEEFCLITGLRFVPYDEKHHRRQGTPNMTFSERVFGHVRARLKVLDLKNVFNNSLDQLSDLDAVRLCLLMLLEVGFMGRESKSVVDPALLQLVEELDSWNTFPRGSYVWKATYEQLHDAMAKRSARFTSIPTTKQLRYSLHGFIWAFKIWIFEVFPYARKFAVRRDGIPRAISWDDNRPITWELALPFVVDATVPRLEPLQVLTPTLAECATDWWRSSRRFFDGFANNYQPFPKKARLSSPLVEVDNQPTDCVADTTTTTMPVEDVADTTMGYRTMEWREDMKKKMLENKLQKPVVMTRLEERDDVSSQCDIICVQGYKVKQSVAQILESVFKKHSDIAAECVFKPSSMGSSFLEIVCEVVSRIQSNDDLEKMEELE